MNDIENTLTPFSFEWWKYFTNKNQNFTEPIVLKNAISDCEIDFLNNETKNVVRQICLKGTNNYGFRIYIDNKEQDNYYTEKFFKNPPLENEDIVQFSNRVFPNQKFGIILNRCEKFSEQLTKKISVLINPLIEQVGIPLTGLDITMFIGNYGWTPLGIHQDHRGENVIHLHLGPGPKDMYTWDEEEYKSLPEFKENNQNIESVLKYSTKFPFKTGDIFYMPWNKYHVGFSDELSIGITIWFNNPTKQTFANKLIESLKLQYIENDKTILSPEIDFINSDTFSFFESIVTKDKKITELSTIDFFKHIHDEFKISIASNAGWAALPLSMLDINGYDVDNDYDILKNKKITTPFPFKTYFNIEDEILYIYTRGTKLEIKYHPELITIINKLNSNEIFNTDELIKQLSIDWPTDAGLYFLSLLYDKRGIEIVT